MKKKYIYVMTLAAGLLGACTDLDTYPEGATITEDQKEDVADLQPEKKVVAATNTVMAAFYRRNAIFSGDFDCGYPGMMIALDTRGYDMVSTTANYNWFLEPLTYSDVSYDNQFDRFYWSTLYNQIYACNQLLKLNDGGEAESAAVRFYRAQAYAVRAFDYWVLAQLYQHTYAGHEGSPCVPIVTEENDEKIAYEGCPRASVEEVYAQILSDLNRALDLLQGNSVSRTDKRFVDRAAVHGLRARVYLTMQRWTDALADAEAAIAGAGAPYAREEVAMPSFVSAADHAWMWGIVTAETDDVVNTVIVNFPSHVCTFVGGGYTQYDAYRMVNKKLFGSIEKSDVRRGWWLDENRLSANLNSTQTSYIAQKGFPAYTNVKFAPYNNEVGTSLNASDIPLMRVEEMYLIKAECLGMSGQLAEGRRFLQEFVRGYRNASYQCTATNVADFRDEVYRQRRIELWGEGLSYFDILRLGKDMDRRGGGYVNPEIIYNIPAGDNALIYRIPQAEEEQNIQISADDNNPISSKPVAVADV